MQPRTFATRYGEAIHSSITRRLRANLVRVSRAPSCSLNMHRRGGCMHGQVSR
jgi:hypothetical protein